ncbi:MAG: DNA repair protein RecO [Cellulosilyticaceae bacterium]
MIIKVNGIVLKEYTVGESDKYITLFTKEQGKIQVSAPRAKKFDRGLATGTQLFVYGEFVLSGYKDTYKLLAVEVKTMFHRLSEDLLALSYATYVGEFVLEVATESGDSERMLTLMLHTIHQLQKKDANLKLIRMIFEIRAMAELGFMLDLSNCSICGKNIEFEEKMTYGVRIEEGGLICNSCNIEEVDFKISYGTCYTIYYIVYTPIKACFNFKIDQTIATEIKRLCRRYIAFYIDRKFKSIDFIKQIESLY